MEEENTPQESPSPDEAPPRRRRGALLGLTALYGLSAVAAGVLIVRAPKDNGRKPQEPSRAMTLLSGQKKDAVGWISIHGPIFPADNSSVFSRGMPQWTRSLRKMAERSE